MRRSYYLEELSVLVKPDVAAKQLKADEEEETEIAPLEPNFDILYKFQHIDSFTVSPRPVDTSYRR